MPHKYKLAKILKSQCIDTFSIGLSTNKNLSRTLKSFPSIFKFLILALTPKEEKLNASAKTIFLSPFILILNTGLDIKLFSVK